MAREDLGRWEPMSVEATVAVFDAAPFRWWLSGGHALELHLGRSWREHDDTDVGVARRDVMALPLVLAGWNIHVASAGRLEPWAGDELDATANQNNLWCRRHTDSGWLLDVTIGDGDEYVWIYRRDRRIQFRWADAVLRTSDGVPYLAPDLQLLFKSKDRREKDDIDAHEVIPHLGVEHRDRLARLLPTEHPWRRLLPA